MGNSLPLLVYVVGGFVVVTAMVLFFHFRKEANRYGSNVKLADRYAYKGMAMLLLAIAIVLFLGYDLIN